MGSAILGTKSEGDETIGPRSFVAQEAQAGCGAICCPYVQVTVAIPIHNGNSAGVIGEIETGHGGDVGERPVVRIQERTFWFMATQRPAMKEQTIKVRIVPAIGGKGIPRLNELVIGNWRLRHDLSP
jgi:hypothetical protein